jgi:hypothetical protein
MSGSARSNSVWARFASRSRRSPTNSSPRNKRRRHCPRLTPVWETLTPNEQARVIELLVERVEYDGRDGKVTVAFHPTGIKSLADELTEYQELTVHSAIVPDESAKWVDPDKKTERQLRLLGYGMPDPSRALRSTDRRVVLLAEDTLEDDHYHIYELDIPAAFAKLRKKRCIRVTLAYDPPVRGTRKEYFVRKLYFRLIKGSSVEEIERQASQGKDCAQPTIHPSIDWVKDSTVQSVCFEGTQPKSFNWDGDDNSFAKWHVVVRSEPRLENDELTPQPYALVVSLEHSELSIQLHNMVRTRVDVRVRQNWS